MQGTTANNQFTAIQSVQACQGPFSIDADALGFRSNGEAFSVELVSADGSEQWSISGDLNPNDPGYGIWSYDPESEATYQDIYSSRPRVSCTT